MCKDFNKKGTAGKKILEKEKFKKEISMRDIISDIKKYPLWLLISLNHMCVTSGIDICYGPIIM